MLLLGSATGALLAQFLLRFVPAAVVSVVIGLICIYAGLKVRSEVV